MIRLLTMVGVVVLGTVTAAHAQPRELRAAEGHSVFVIDVNRQEWQGRLLKVSADALEVESDAGIRTFKLTEVRRVDAERDGVWDGALKGAVLGGVLGLLAASAGETGLWPMATNAMSFGLIGLAIDGGCSSRHPVYHGTVPRVAVSAPKAMRFTASIRW
jgi:hypothetical protein